MVQKGILHISPCKYAWQILKLSPVEAIVLLPLHKRIRFCILHFIATVFLKYYIHNIYLFSLQIDFNIIIVKPNICLHLPVMRKRWPNSKASDIFHKYLLRFNLFLLLYFRLILGGNKRHEINRKLLSQLSWWPDSICNCFPIKCTAINKNSRYENQITFLEIEYNVCIEFLL